MRNVCMALALTLVAASPCHAWFGYTTHLGQVCWSPDSRRIAFTAFWVGMNVDYAGDVVMWMSVDDSLALPTVVTPPPYGVPAHRKALKATWRDDLGLFLLTVPGGTTVRRIFTDTLSWSIESLQWSPDDKRLAWTVHGRDDNERVQTLLRAIGIDEPAPVGLTEWVPGMLEFCWKDSDTVLYSTAPHDSHPAMFWAVAARTGGRRVASADELRKCRRARVSSHASATGPAPMSTLPDAGHAPVWISDSTILFRAGAASAPANEDGEPLDDLRYPDSSEFWLANINTGRVQLAPAEAKTLHPLHRLLGSVPSPFRLSLSRNMDDTIPVPSPDGKRVVRFPLWGVFLDLTAPDGTGGRTLVSGGQHD